MNQQETIASLLSWIGSVTPEGAQVIIPVSGGSDSALCYWLYTQALPGRVVGVYIGANLRAKGWFEQHGTVRYSDVQIEGSDPEIERWAHFLRMSIRENRILVGSRNRTEDTLGTFSHASKVCSFLPLASLWKSEVMALCEFVGVPKEVLASSKRADPACGRPRRMADIPFETVDAFLQGKLREKNGGSLMATTEQLQYLERVYDQNAYKKALPLKGPSGLPAG